MPLRQHDDLVCEVPSDEIERLRSGRPRDEELSKKHKKVEHALLFDPRLLDGLSELEQKTALLMSFNARGSYATVWPGPDEARSVWQMGGHLPKRSEPKRSAWGAMYDGLADRLLVRLVDPDWESKGRKHPKYEILVAPVRTADGLRSTMRPRSVWELIHSKIPNVALPTGYDKLVGRRDANEIRILFALHALSDRSAWMGVDPNHLCIRDGSLRLSASLAQSLRVTAPTLLDQLLGWEGAGLLGFIPTVFEEIRIYPAASPHVFVKGAAESLGSDFRVRMTHGVDLT